MMREIEKEFIELAKDFYANDVNLDSLTEDDVKMWGYDSLDDFCESNT